MIRSLIDSRECLSLLERFSAIPLEVMESLCSFRYERMLLSSFTVKNFLSANLTPDLLTLDMVERGSFLEALFGGVVPLDLSVASPCLESSVG